VPRGTSLRPAGTITVKITALSVLRFATGEHSVTTLRDLLEDAGLRSRRKQKRPAKPQRGPSDAPRRLLHRDPHPEGRQARRSPPGDHRPGDLRESPASPRRHPTFGGSQPEVRQEVRSALSEQLGTGLEYARNQSEKHTRRLRDLQNEQQKLLQLFYRDGVDEDILQAEQQRISAERTQAERWLNTAKHETQEAEQALDEALAFIRGCHATYMDADAEQRRLMNQAIFVQIFVRIDASKESKSPPSPRSTTSAARFPLRAPRGPTTTKAPVFPGALV
jgi:hypothetical protein